MNPAAEPDVIRAKNIINASIPNAKLWIFGSRATGGNKPSSDLDLCVDAGEKISLEKMATIKRELEQSDIPYRVDVVDKQSVDEDFLSIIKSTAREI